MPLKSAVHLKDYFFIVLLLTFLILPLVTLFKVSTKRTSDLGVFVLSPGDVTAVLQTSTPTVNVNTAATVNLQVSAAEDAIDYRGSQFSVLIPTTLSVVQGSMVVNTDIFLDSSSNVLNSYFVNQVALKSYTPDPTKNELQITLGVTPANPTDLLNPTYPIDIKTSAGNVTLLSFDVQSATAGSYDIIFRSDFSHGFVVLDPADSTSTINLLGPTQNLTLAVTGAPTPTPTPTPTSTVTPTPTPTSTATPTPTPTSTATPSPTPNSAPIVNTLTTDKTTYTIGEVIDMSATASDGDAGDSVSKVVFYFDDGMLGEDTSSPYSWLFNTSNITAGTHTVKAVAYDTTNTPSADKTTDVTVNAPQGANLTSAKDLSVSYKLESKAGSVKGYAVPTVFIGLWRPSTNVMLESKVVSTDRAGSTGVLTNFFSRNGTTYTLEATDLLVVKPESYLSRVYPASSLQQGATSSQTLLLDSVDLLSGDVLIDIGTFDVINARDYVFFGSYFGSGTTYDVYFVDLNGDGKVSSLDFINYARNIGVEGEIKTKASQYSFDSIALTKEVQAIMSPALFRVILN